MKRLVVKSQAGSLYYNDTQKGVKLEPHEITPHQRRLLLERLYIYEDTGLTPEEIVELKERDTAKEIQKVDEQPYFWKRFHSYICPVCHKKVEFGWLFCGHCGQKLKKKD